LTKNEITVGEFATENGSVLVRRLKNGEINLLGLLPPAAKKAEMPEQKQDSQTDKPWVMKVTRLAVDQYRLKWEDQVPSEAVQILLNEIGVKGENLATAKDQKGRLSLTLRVDQKGKVTVGGGVGIDPLSADLEVGVQEVEIPRQLFYGPGQDHRRMEIFQLPKSFQKRGKGLQISTRESNLNQFSIDKPNAGFPEMGNPSSRNRRGDNPFTSAWMGRPEQFLHPAADQPRRDPESSVILSEPKKRQAAAPWKKPAPTKIGGRIRPSRRHQHQRVNLQEALISPTTISANYSPLLELGGGERLFFGRGRPRFEPGMLGQIAPSDHRQAGTLGKDLFVIERQTKDMI
jgi:hypothetical protein